MILPPGAQTAHLPCRIPSPCEVNVKCQSHKNFAFTFLSVFYCSLFKINKLVLFQCCLDERWGDWRPHLAMILSNPTGRPEVDHRAIATLGDTLGSRGCLHAAHFCYLMAQLPFGSYAHKSSKIVLIGSSHTLPFQLFATNEAIFATEIFEFACHLADPDFVLHHLQVRTFHFCLLLNEIFYWYALFTDQFPL